MKPAKWSVPQAREGGCHADLGLHLAGGFCGPAFSPARTRAHKASPASPTHRCPPKPRVNAELRPRAGLSELRPPRRRRAQQGETERGAPGPDLGDGRLFGVAGADAAHPTPSLPRLRWSSGGMAGGGQGLAFASTPGPWPLYPFTPHPIPSSAPLRRRQALPRPECGGEVVGEAAGGPSRGGAMGCRATPPRGSRVVWCGGRTRAFPPLACWLPQSNFIDCAIDWYLARQPDQQVMQVSRAAARSVSQDKDPQSSCHRTFESN